MGVRSAKSLHLDLLRAAKSPETRGPAGSRRWFPRAESLIVVLCLSSRVILGLLSEGTNDIRTWQHFGAAVSARGVLFCYENVSGFNHPPLMGYWAALVWKLAQATGWRFDLLFKVLPLLGDLLVLRLLLRGFSLPPGRRLLVGLAFALSPVSILITGHHGNTDPLCAAFALLACLQLERGRPLAAGLSIAAALNVKLIPVFLAVALFLFCRGVPRKLGYVAGCALGLLPFVPVLVASGKAFYVQAIAYNSNRDLWGIYGLSKVLSTMPHADWMSRWAEAYFAGGRYLILFSSMLWAVLGRYWHWSARHVGLSAFVSFAVLTPGFGVQYVAYPLAFLLLTNLADGITYSLLGGLFLGFTYYRYWDQSHPYFTWFDQGVPPAAACIGFMAWIILARGFARVASQISVSRGSSFHGTPG